MKADPEFFERAVMVHRPFVVSRLPQWARDEELRDDMVNAVFEVAWKSWTNYRPSKGSLTTWLDMCVKTISDRTINTMHCHRETFHRQLFSLDCAGDDDETWSSEHEAIADPHAVDPLKILIDAQDEIDTSNLRSKLMAAARRLPELQARAWKLRLQGETLDAIGAMEGVSRQAIHRRLDKHRDNFKAIATRHFEAVG